MPSYPIQKLNPKRVILSVGGSIIVPNEIDTDYLKDMRAFVMRYIEQEWSFTMVVGGGAPARKYIEAARTVMDGNLASEDMDWLGIHATRFNSHLVRTIFRDVAQPNIVTNPERSPINEKKKVVVVSGWKPGWSTDFVAAKIAERFGAKVIVNLSNIKQVYTADPKKDPNAKPVSHMTWREYRDIIGGETWIPGFNSPFDPIASKMCDEQNITVVVLNGADIPNLEKCMRGEEFVGTILSNS